MIFRHVSDCFQFQTVEDETLEMLLNRFVIYSAKPGEPLFDPRTGLPQSPVIYVLLNGGILMVPLYAESGAVGSRRLGAGAVIGNLPEAGLSLEQILATVDQPSQLAILSYADWDYLNQNRYWRGVPLGS